MDLGPTTETYQDPCMDWSTAVPTPALQDIAHRIPRHVPSRLLYTDKGDVIWRPTADVFETDEAFVIHVDLPGVPKHDIKIEMEGYQLTIHGTSPHHGFESATSRVRERHIGRFRKIINLPTTADVDADVDRNTDVNRTDTPTEKEPQSEHPSQKNEGEKQDVPAAPALDKPKVKAKYENGLLEVCVPKKKGGTVITIM
ncbi:HSP20-like chaperone [Gaertneriomyces semiglobifer]|nr:HSP20-like chaperone [Gaertneriomyces semiglobifer]